MSKVQMKVVLRLREDQDVFSLMNVVLGTHKSCLLTPGSCFEDDKTKEEGVISKGCLYQAKLNESNKKSLMNILLMMIRMSIEQVNT